MDDHDDHEDHDPNNKTVDALVKRYNITKSVVNNNHVLIRREPLRDGEFHIDYLKEVVVISFDAYVGQKGNRAAVRIPFSSIKVLAAKISAREAKQKMLNEIKEQHPRAFE